MLIQEIWRFPVKSVGGESLTSARVDEHGIEGDRGWGIFDPATGLVLTARREPALLFLTARLVDGQPHITSEDGTHLGDDASLSERLGRPVELRRAGDSPATFENPMDVDNESDWITWDSSDGTYHDSRSKISLVSRSSVGEWDHRRFRINLITDGAGENDMAGRLTIGSTELEVRHPIDRCVMVTRAQPGIERDISVLKRVIAEHHNKLGVGATISNPGTITVGDDVVALPASTSAPTED